MSGDWSVGRAVQMVGCSLVHASVDGVYEGIFHDCALTGLCCVARCSSRGRFLVGVSVAADFNSISVGYGRCDGISPDTVRISWRVRSDRVGR